MLPVYFLLCFSFAAASQISIKDFAVPSQVKAGEGVELQCRSSLLHADIEVKWWWTPAEPNSQRTQIYQRLGQQPPQTLHKDIFKVVKVKANDTIELENLQPSHSGTFECECSTADELYEDRRKQALVVYTPGTGPTVNVTVVKNETSGDQDYQLTCNADGVAPEPDLVLTINGKLITVDETELSNGTADGLWSVSSVASLDELESGAELKCELFFRDSAITHPAYIHLYTYEGSAIVSAYTSILLNTRNEPHQRVNAVIKLASGAANDWANVYWGLNAYNLAGGRVPDPEQFEVNSKIHAELENATTPVPGSSVAHSSSAVLLVLATLSQFLHHH